jgi:hypothetical protein
MLHDKIDYASSKQACNKEFATLVEVAAVPPLPITTDCAGAPVISWFIENYATSAHQTKENQENADFWTQFK